MKRIESLEPILGGKPKILILGSMPSVVSLERREYYGHGRNQFWRIMGDLFGFKANASYEYRKAAITSKGIAVWDVLKSCERKGSLDQNIQKMEYNDIVGLIRRVPSIQLVVLNGGTAKSVFLKEFKESLPDIKIISLGSTSPAYTISYERKLEQWREILQYV